MKKLLIAIVMVVFMVLGADSPGYAVQSPNTWSQVGNLATGINSLAAVNGTLYAVTGSGSVRSWNGSTWTEVGNIAGAAGVGSLAAVNGTLYAGGFGVWSWNGSTWSPVGSMPGNTGPVTCLATVNDMFYAGTHHGGVWSWNGSTWTEVGSLTSNTESVSCLAAVNGTVYAGMASGGVWSWNGSTWTEVGNLAGNAAYVFSLATANGTLYAGGSGVWSWNGSAWSPVGSLPGPEITGNETDSLAAFNGTLYAGTNNGYGVWSWNGSAWSPEGNLTGIISNLVVINGTLYTGTGDGVWSLPLTPVTTPTPTVFTDVPGSHWAYADIVKLSGLSYINGYPDDTFRPNTIITRAEFASVLDKTLKIQVSNWAAAPGFSDVSPSDWFYGSVERLVYAGIAKGYGSSFAPNNPITRQELAVILINAIGQQEAAKTSMDIKTDFTDDKSISPWARGFVATAVKDGLLKGYPDNNFQPQGNTTRAEACIMIVNLLNAQK